MYDFSVRQLISLHLAKFGYLDPGIEFGAPIEITQDGVAAAAGITRAHACTVLLRMEKSGEVTIGQSRIKGSNCRVRRKVYFLTALGKERVDKLLSDLEASGVPASELATPPTVNRMSTDMMRGLSQKDRDVMGMLCVLRHDVSRGDLESDPPGLLYDGKGVLALKDDVRRRFLDTGSEDERRRWHSLAADMCLGDESLMAERLHHLRMAGRRKEAARLALGNLRRLTGDGDAMDDLIDLCKEAGDENLGTTTATLALRSGDVRRAREALESSGNRFGPAMSEVLLAEGDRRGALDMALRSYTGDAMSALALGKAMNAAGRHEEALVYLTASRRRMMESGSLFRMDEEMEAEAEADEALGRKERASALRKAAEAARRWGFKGRCCP
jgi:hypothetical protein